MKRKLKSIMALLLHSGWLFFMPAGILLAMDAASQSAGQEVVREEQALSQESGSFNGYSKKSNRLWVNDRVYLYKENLKVIGTSKKIGLLSDIRLGEPVVINFLTRSEQIPLVFEIKRQ